MKTSVTTYSFHQYINAGKMTQFDTIAKAKEIGFDGIEFTDLPGETLEERKAKPNAPGGPLDYARHIRDANLGEIVVDHRPDYRV